MTVKALYQRYTGDLAAHQRAIDGRFRKLTDQRRRIIAAAASGRTLREIATSEGIGHGAVDTILRRSMESIRKDLHHEPRYNKNGRRKQRQEEPAPVSA
jgi:DNA-directed RNA polymerase specialized sigma24 family protein